MFKSPSAAKSLEIRQLHKPKTPSKGQGHAVLKPGGKGEEKPEEKGLTARIEDDIVKKIFTD